LARILEERNERNERTDSILSSFSMMLFTQTAYIGSARSKPKKRHLNPLASWF